MNGHMDQLIGIEVLAHHWYRRCTSEYENVGRYKQRTRKRYDNDLGLSSSMALAIIKVKNRVEFSMEMEKRERHVKQVENNHLLMNFLMWQTQRALCAASILSGTLALCASRQMINTGEKQLFFFLSRIHFYTFRKIPRSGTEANQKRKSGRYFTEMRKKII